MPPVYGPQEYPVEPVPEPTPEQLQREAWIEEGRRQAHAELRTGQLPPVPQYGDQYGTPPQAHYPQAYHQPQPYQQPHPQYQFQPQFQPQTIQQSVVVNTRSRGCNHPLHLVLTILTVGLWLPVWILCAIFQR